MRPEISEMLGFEQEGSYESGVAIEVFLNILECSQKETNGLEQVPIAVLVS